MPAHESGTARRTTRLLYTAGLFITSLALLVAAPGAANAAPVQNPGSGSSPDHVEPGEAWMGVGVRAHEGGDPSGGVEPKSAGPGVLATVHGVDVSSHQGNVSWSTLWNSGVRWAYVKATEGTGYTNDYFTQQYNGSYNVGMIRGAYHFALPNKSSGAAQADYFVKHGGGWSKDGKTLPGVLDIEYNPYGSTCYGKSASSMVSWIKDFTGRYKAHTGRDAVIYTTTGWWKQCTGNSGSFGSTNPLWIARYSSSPGELPNGWGFYTFWQYTSTGPTVGDHNVFNGSMDRLKVLANG